MIKVNVDVVSDVMCPWCYIGKRRLETALSKLENIEVTLTWRPYQLDSTIPAEGKDRQTYLENKFGGAKRATEVYNRIEEAGRLDGIDFEFAAIKIAPNTLDAHRVIRWSISEGADVQDKLVERLFELFFIKGVNIGDHDVLVDAAEFAGMDSQLVKELLATDKDVAAVDQEIAVAQQMGVTGVPCFIIENKYAVVGAQEADQIAAAITQASQMKEVAAPGH